MHPVRQWFERARRIPGGLALFSKALGVYIPYTGSTGAEIQFIGDGEAIVRLPDRRRVRNHLDSLHAIALASVGELSTGLAVIGALPGSGRMIMRHLEVEYHSKARGDVIATGRARFPVTPGRHEVAATSEVRDANGNLVTTVTATWVVEIS
jgi:acyl-coenzyme A thioesterase PaaI-like protein